MPEFDQESDLKDSTIWNTYHTFLISHRPLKNGEDLVHIHNRVRFSVVNDAAGEVH